MENWIDKAIEHEATPEPLREMSVTEFLKKYNVASSTYYYQMRKKENQEKILEIALTFAKRHTPEVLENLAERAKKDDRAAEMFMKYILKLVEKFDLKITGENYDEEQIKAIARRALQDGGSEGQAVPDRLLDSDQPQV